MMSESEAEFDLNDNQVTLPKDAGCANTKGSKSAIRLVEMGPRMKFKLIKIEEGICEGKVLYHSFVGKSEEEISEIRQILKQKK